MGFLVSSPAARMEVDSVHVVKRIVALLVDSFQPSHLPPAQQVRSRNTGHREAFPPGVGKELRPFTPQDAN